MVKKGDDQDDLDNTVASIVPMSRGSANSRKTGSGKGKAKIKMYAAQDLSGGDYVKAYSANFDLIINILVNIRRSLSNLVELPGASLEKRLFEQKITTITDYVSRESSGDP